MKNKLFKPVMLIPFIIGIILFSCKPDDFTSEDALLLQAKLDKEAALLKDSLNKASQSVTYTLSLVDASSVTLTKSGTEAKGSMSGAVVTLTQNGKSTTQTAAATGLLIFPDLQKGLATINVTLAGYSEVNAVIDFSSYLSSVTGGVQYGNILAMIPISGTSTGTIKGTVYCESDLTNLVPEIVPAGTKVIATIDLNSPAFDNIKGGIIQSISYDKLALSAVTDASGSFTMTVPGSAQGLNYDISVADFSTNQLILMNTKNGLPVTGVQTIPTVFGSSNYSGSSSIPYVSPMFITIGAPDYTFTAATATAVISNVNGIDYIQKTNSGTYYRPNSWFYDVTVDNPAVGTGGSKAMYDFYVDANGQVATFDLWNEGAGYPTSANNSAFTLPYIKVAAKATVQAVDAAGAITSWRVTTAGQFFSTSNLEFVRSTGAGVGTLPLPTTYYNWNYMYCSTATQIPATAIGSGFAVGDELTLSVKSAQNNPMTGNIVLTTGRVSTINVTTAGTNYFAGRVDVTIDSPGTIGTTATATANVVDGKISSITINNSGSNYTTVPNVKIFNKVNKIQATATANVNSIGVITSVNLNGGDGYLAVPTVTVTPSVPGKGTLASLGAAVGGGRVTNLAILNAGMDYTGWNRPASTQNAPYSTYTQVLGGGTSIITINLGTGKRTIEY